MTMKSESLCSTGILCLLILFGLLGTHVSTSWGSIYYVSPSGSDDHPGTEAQPWKTIKKAADTLSPGDTVYIKAGIYRERVVPQNSGNPDHFIVYASYPGDEVTIDGSGILVPEWSGLFEVLTKAYIRVSGLRIINSISNPHNPGILVEDSNHIIVERNYIHNTNDSGIAIWSSNNITIDGNEIEGVCLRACCKTIDIFMVFLLKIC
jgi:parallel beta-helix repeat protein